uniref:OSJNBa0027G07.12 protein n=1 Tax=Oryza sativa subsp. japonica TaxID=39947 RepID=Q7XUX9_ORYSJ|nr:OSJNBa0027G07.12 [Oryza sativa Japonica Group]
MEDASKHWAPRGAVLTAFVVGINLLMVLLVFFYFWRFFSGVYSASDVGLGLGDTSGNGKAVAVEAARGSAVARQSGQVEWRRSHAPTQSAWNVEPVAAPREEARQVDANSGVGARGRRWYAHWEVDVPRWSSRSVRPSWSACSTSPRRTTSASSRSSAPPLTVCGFTIMEKLTKLNHAVWAAQMLAAIRGARLVGHIDGKTAAPSTKVNQEQADKTVKKVPNPVYEEWYAADQQLLGYIFSSLSREILNQVADSRTAAQAWRAIGKLFCSQTRTRSLNNRLALQTTLKGAMSITEYFGKMKVLSDDIAATGKPLDEEDLIAYILNGLDGDYDSVVSAIGMKSEPISVMEVYSQLLNFENRLQLKQEGIAAAHAASRGRGGFIPRSGGNGGGSGGSGRGRSAPPANNGGRGRGNMPRGRGQQQQRTDPRPICQVCYKRGHVAAECWHRFDENYVPDDRHVAAAAQASSYAIDTNWYIDSGATNHITSELDKLAVREKYKGPE